MEGSTIPHPACRKASPEPGRQQRYGSERQWQLGRAEPGLDRLRLRSRKFQPGRKRQWGRPSQWKIPHGHPTIGRRMEAKRQKTGHCSASRSLDVKDIVG
ncbi:hypothetical protein ASPVEDRAFT_533361 [Aspergillus versicolor CBS 583.65]|uniref:Uncharacterized protein n=1 Tax=Aspergillus versicolor CBS 583.65 TaxID=1036611 RepID=A0A1L9PEP5_ASPVE|nr:uncharacterized protein ASPVEDRAFT_533361 [Aspergillus versicolor CBS 583.65]OJI99915.1 hypothetical protein ASPVEDRAFT_533361 [Aspergillus versicolor CBS 583.65]